MNTELKVSFYLKRERKNEKNGSKIYPIVGKITVGKTVAQFGSKLKVDERLWNVKSGRAAGKSKIATELNRELNKINLLIHCRHESILKRTGKVTANQVKNAFQGIASSQTGLLELCDEMMLDLHSRTDVDRAMSTYFTYESSLKHLRRFIRKQFKVQDIPVTQANLSFIENFVFYLRIERKLKPGSIINILVPLQRAVRIAKHRNMIDLLPFEGFKPEKPESQIRSLSEEEFERFVAVSLSDSTLQLVRDLFVFASFTGISYVDLKNLTRDEIITEQDGSLWISKSRQKTDIPFNVKLLDIPVGIMEKYKGSAKENHVFPMPSRINRILKQIANICGIDRQLTFHMSRHTFASQICLSQGVPIESISKMLGHRSIKTTQRYARISNEKIISDIKLLSENIVSQFTYSYEII